MVDVGFFWTAWAVFFILMIPRWKMGDRAMDAYLPDGTWRRAWYFGILIVCLGTMALTFMPAFDLTWSDLL
tara:strand:+ start:213 stop:425 length:213 start_codon:yes stop_codon:yes gene_type:complete